ncbi:MAG: hypothetical protein Q4A15_10310, partial [Prevotellaceae bacterium]|nr:hypothetical protein [Prevotellaceae bacterium]
FGSRAESLAITGKERRRDYDLDIIPTRFLMRRVLSMFASSSSRKIIVAFALNFSRLPCFFSTNCLDLLFNLPRKFLTVGKE